MKHRPGLDRFIPALTSIILSTLVLTDCVQKNCQQVSIEVSDNSQCQQGDLYSCKLSDDSASNLWANRISFNQLPPDVRKTIFQLDLQVRTTQCQAIDYLRPNQVRTTR